MVLGARWLPIEGEFTINPDEVQIDSNAAGDPIVLGNGAFGKASPRAFPVRLIQDRTKCEICHFPVLFCNYY